MTQSTVGSRSLGRVTGPLLLVVTLAYFGALAPYGLELADEGHLISQIHRTYLGQVPYVDFHTGYTPGVYYWNAALFRLFGVNLLAVRGCLAVINGLGVACLYWLVRRVGGSRFAAATAGLLSVALIPFYDGHFAPFNIPYPAWYVTLFWLLSLICVVEWWTSRRGWLWALAGLCAGTVFAFKQNSGLLNLAALLIAMGLLERPVAGAEPVGVGRWLRRAERLLRWMVPFGGALGLMLMMGRSGGAREVYVFALPLAVVVAWELFAPVVHVARPVPPLTLVRHAVLVAVGFAAVTLPWTAYFWPRLGARAFLRSILYIGGSYEQFYFIGYPVQGRASLAIVGGLGLLLLTSLLVAWRWVSARLIGAALVAAAVVGGTWLLRHPPPMVEGFQKSVVMRVEDLAFALILCLEWIAIGVHIAQTAGRRSLGSASVMTGAQSEGTERTGPAGAPGAFLIVLVSAILMHAQLYPRSDFMHLVYAAPGVLILGARMLDDLAAVWVRHVAPTPAWRRTVRIVAFAPVYALVLILLAPAVARIGYLARSAWQGDGTAVVRLETSRAPLVVEPAAGRVLLGLSSVVRYLEQHSQPTDLVFTFPCLDIMSFLADRRDPTRHGYYYPGSPGHAVEAEVIDSLRAHPPRYIVALHDHALFFVPAPLYYFNLRHYVMKHYSLERRLGMFDVLRRDEVRASRGREESPPSLAAAAAGAGSPDEAQASSNGESETSDLAEALVLWHRELRHRSGATVRHIDAVLQALPVATTAALADALAALDTEEQRLVALLIRKTRSPAGAAALASALEGRGLPSTLRELFLRIIAEFGDLRSVVPLLRALRTADFADLGSLSGDLFTIASRSWIENYWYAPSRRSELPAIETMLPDEQIIRWMDNPRELLALRSFAIRMAGRRRSHAFIPFLVRLLGDRTEHPQLRSDAAHSLVELGFGPQVFGAIGALLSQTDLVPAVLTIELYPQEPNTGREVLVESMTARNAGQRATAFWAAAALQDPKLVPDLRAGLSDPLPEVRMAAIWGLGNVGGDGALAALQQTTHDGNDEVEAFAARTIQRVALGSSPSAQRVD
jgi:HEAT repeat protein